MDSQHYEILSKSPDTKLHSQLVQTVNNDQFDTTLFKFKVIFEKHLTHFIVIDPTLTKTNRTGRTKLNQ